MIEEILTMPCPRCCAAFCDFDGCLALVCKRGCGFCTVCMTDSGAGAHAHAHVRNGCGFVDLGGDVFANREGAMCANGAWRTSMLQR